MTCSVVTYCHMSDNTISISQLKMNPAAAIAQSINFPLEVESRGKTQAYLVGKKLFEKIIEYMEDQEDIATVKSIKPEEYKQAGDFEEFARELGI